MPAPRCPFDSAVQDAIFSGGGLDVAMRAFGETADTSRHRYTGGGGCRISPEYTPFFPATTRDEIFGGGGGVFIC